MDRIILHIDFDSFFASVAQQDNPLLRNRPVGVTATNGRTCIIAASREAKAFGIKSPSRTFDAQKICPSIIFVPAAFVRYWEVSKQFINICKYYSPSVEIFSLDEVFLDVTHTAPLFGGVYGIVDKIKAELQTEIGDYVTASCGISHNKLLSKLASGLKKPNGVVEINEKNLAEVYQSAKLTDICGIGRRIEDRLNSMGVSNLPQLQKVSLNSLTSEFGDYEGKFLHQVGLGIDERSVIPYTDAPSVKSVGRSYCLPYNEPNQRKILQNIYELSEEVGIKLRRIGKKAKAIGIYLGGEENIHGRKTYSYYMDSGQDIFTACMDSINYQTSGYVRQIGIWASHLEDKNNLPMNLFIDNQRQQKLTEAVDGLNEKFGDHTIRNAFLLYADKLTTVPNGFMADKYERTKLAKEQAGFD